MWGCNIRSSLHLQDASLRCGMWTCWCPHRTQCHKTHLYLPLTLSLLLPPSLLSLSTDSHMHAHTIGSVSFSSVQFSLSVISDSLQPHGLQHTRLPCPSPTPGAYSNSCPSSQWCHPTISSILSSSLLLLPSTFPSIRVSCSESVLCITWPKYWSFSFSISPSNEYSGLISFRIDGLDLLVVQGALKSLFQHHSLKPSVLGTLFSLQSNSHIHTWLLEKP